MKTVAVIFAGGTGSRMKSNRAKPKQFLVVHGKPIIVHTIEIFQRAQDIDAVIVTCIEGWIPHMKDLKELFRLDKITQIVPGGKSGQESIYHGLVAAENEFGAEDVIVLIHDGVRPLINEEIIISNIESVKRYRSAITCSPATETFVLIDDDGEVVKIADRNHSRIAKAPQSFYLKDILEVHRTALADGLTDVIDSCTLMNRYGKELAIVMGPHENIKITTPEDFFMFKALFDAMESSQIDRI